MNAPLSAHSPVHLPPISEIWVYLSGSPLLALHHFLNELRQCPGATDLQAGDVVTTGTWTDAFAIAPGEQWSVQFSAPLPSLSVAMQ